MSFLTVDDVDADRLHALLDQADGFLEVLDRERPKVPALQGKTVAMLFFEPSTRTRMSFDRAAKALSADTMSFSPAGSSLSKDESLRDTVQTIKAMGPDLFVVRHRATGAPCARRRVVGSTGHQRRRWRSPAPHASPPGLSDHPTAFRLARRPSDRAGRRHPE